MPQERVLVAENEPDVRAMCLRALQIGGYEPVGVADGQEAVERARQEHFDLLLTDIKMPNMSGLEAYRAIREFEPELAAVVMTGFGTMEAAIEALRLGVYEFVLKPFRPNELNEAVGRALTRQRLERENARLRALIPLFELSRVFVSSVDLAVVPKHVVRIAKEEMQADICSLMLLDDNGELFVHSAEGLSEEALASGRRSANEGVAGYVLSQRQPLILTGDVSDDPRFRATYRSQEITSAISLPLLHKDRAIGVLNVAKTHDGPPFNEGDLELLSVLGSQAAVAIENARMFGEIQEAYQRLSELDYLKSEFINVAAHELRSPLAVVLAYASLLEDEATGPMRDHLTQVTQAAMQLKSIIDDMVSLQHVDTGQATVHLAAIEVAPVVQEAIEDLRLLAERKALTIRTELPANLPRVKADPHLFRLILGNLLSNAVKFTPERGEVTVFARAEEGQVVTAGGCRERGRKWRLGAPYVLSF